MPTAQTNNHIQSAGEELLALRGVSKSFGAVQALTDIDLNVSSGEVVALLGDNGAGKSTLIKILSGVHVPDKGEVLFEGEPVSFAGPREARARGIACTRYRYRLPGPRALRQP